MFKAPVSAALLLIGTHALAAEATLSVQSSKMIPNDQLSLSMSYESQAKTAAELNQTLDAELNKALAVAKGYPEVTTSLVGRSAYPTYSDRQKITGWRGQNRLELKSKNFEQIGKLSQALSSSFSISSVNYEVSDQLEKEVQNQLISSATKDFQERATLISSSLGHSNYTVKSIDYNFSNQSYRPSPVYAKAMSTMAEAAPDLASGNGETKVSVNVHGSITTP